MKIFKNPTSWFEKHTRFYYSLFYFVTGIMFMALAYYTSMTPLALEPFYWFGSHYWVIAYLIEALFLLTLGFTVNRTTSGRSLRTRFKQFATIYGVVLILCRGINIFRLGIGGIGLLIVPLWAAFILAWVAPMIWYLPTKISEYRELRDKSDELDKRLKSIEALESIYGISKPDSSNTDSTGEK